MSIHTFSALFSVFPLLALAVNDWSQPCLQGTCSYDIPSSETSMGGSMIISGSSNAISDITTAAGWEILNCTSDAFAQDVRLVCSGDEASCSQIFQNGAEHTIVRLPEDCGRSPFAHVSKAWVSEDQSIPENVSSRIVRRDGTTPAVYALSLDTDFSQASASQNGNVSLIVLGSTIPGVAGNAILTAPSSRRRSRLVDRRGLSDIVSKGLDTLESAFSITNFNKSISTELPPIDIDKQFNIFNTTLSCSSNEQAKVSVDIGAKAHAQVTLGLIAVGSIVPFEISDIGVFAGMSADLDGTLNIVADIVGEIDSGSIQLFTVGIPGLDIPGILSVGPAFSINAEATATIDLDMDMCINLAYSIDNLQLFFPPSGDHPSTADASPGDTQLKLSVSPGVSSNASFSVHLIPSIDIGLKVSSSSATVFLDLDTSATLDLGLEASASTSVDTSGATGASAQVSGCVDVKGGISVNAGAEGSLLGLFDATTQVSLFSKDFDFFQKCFSDSTAASSGASNSTTTVSSLSTLTAPLSADSITVESSMSGLPSQVSSVPAVNTTTALGPSAHLSLAQTSISPSANTTVITSGTPLVSLVPLTSNATRSVNRPTFQASQTSQPTSTSFSTSNVGISARRSSTDATSIALSASSDAFSATTLSVSSSSSLPTRSAALSTSILSSKTIASTPTGTRRRYRRGHGRRSSVRMHAKRGFSCPAGDILAATSVVDETLSSSTFKDL